MIVIISSGRGVVPGRGGGGILNNWLRLYDEGEIRVNTAQPSLVDAPLIALNKEEGADKHGKDTRDARVAQNIKNIEKY